MQGDKCAMDVFMCCSLGNMMACVRTSASKRALGQLDQTASLHETGAGDAGWFRTELCTYSSRIVHT